MTSTSTMKSTIQGVVDEIYTIFLDEVLMHRCLLVGPSRMRFIDIAAMH